VKTDSLLYRLFQSDPALVFGLAGLSVPEPERYRFVAQEVKQTAFRLDGLLEPPDDLPDAPRVYLEAQAQPDPSFYLRFFGEILVHLRQYPAPRPWHAVVLYPKADLERSDACCAPFLQLPNLCRIYLDELPLLDSPEPKLWLLALMLAEPGAVGGIVDKVKAHRESHPGDGIDWVDWLETVLVYKIPYLTREEIQAMFHLTRQDLQRSRFYQEVFAEGRAEGEAQGRAEGEAQGRAEGEAALLSRLLERKFGPLPDSARGRIAAADAETLLSWGERLLDARTLDEVWGG
jgi:predicted transposase YdaD